MNRTNQLFLTLYSANNNLNNTRDFRTAFKSITIAPNKNKKNKKY